MNILKKGFDFYIFSNIHVALSGYALTEITLYQFDISKSLCAYFVGLSILLSYNFIRFYEYRRTKIIWFKQWFKNQRKLLLAIMTISFFGLLGIGFSKQFDQKSLLLLFPFAIMTFFYVIPIFKSKNFEFSFRNTSYIKIWSISLAWAGVTVLFPLYEAGVPLDKSVQTVFLQRFLFLFSILIPFDIRDLQYDMKSLKTIPQVLGIRRSKMIGSSFLLVFLFIEFFYRSQSTLDLVISVIIIGITMIFLWLSNKKRSKYFTGFLIEGIPIVWFILISLFLGLN